MPDATLGPVPHIVLGLYLALLLFFGVQGYRRRRSESEEDYYLAGRAQGWVVTSLTIMATSNGARTRGPSAAWSSAWASSSRSARSSPCWPAIPSPT